MIRGLTGGLAGAISLAVATMMLSATASAQTYSMSFEPGIASRCAGAPNQQVAPLRLRVTSSLGFNEPVHIFPNGGSGFPYFFVLGASPNPAVPPANGSVVVNIGLGVNAVGTGGQQILTFRGQSAWTGIQKTASTTLLVSVPPGPAYPEVVIDGNTDMPQSPYFRWGGTVNDVQFELNTCPGPSTLNCFPLLVSPPQCDVAYCATFDAGNFTHQVPIRLQPGTSYAWRALPYNQCGTATEQQAPNGGPVRPLFTTAQACFQSNFPIPDGGSIALDGVVNAAAGTADNLRVTLHSDHSRVSDLRVSIAKVAPVAGPTAVVMNRPNTQFGGNSCSGPRIQASFGDGGFSVNESCRTNEPTIQGRFNSLSPLGVFGGATGVQAAGTWRLVVEDTVQGNGFGSVLEWCVSSGTIMTAVSSGVAPPDNLFLQGFELGSN